MKRMYVEQLLAAEDIPLSTSAVNDILASPAKSFWEIKGAVGTALCENDAEND